MSLHFRGRVWCFGDDINTDLALPIDVYLNPRDERKLHVFRANRPGWAAQVQAGDILVAGRNLGMGSGRPAAQAIMDLGIACVLADSINGLFLRNCANYGLPALAVPGVRDQFEEGQEAEVFFDTAEVLNMQSGKRLRGKVWPDFMQQCVMVGGLINKLEAEGYLHPEGWRPSLVKG